MLELHLGTSMSFVSNHVCDHGSYAPFYLICGFICNTSQKLNLQSSGRNEIHPNRRLLNFGQVALLATGSADIEIF